MLRALRRYGLRREDTMMYNGYVCCRYAKDFTYRTSGVLCVGDEAVYEWKDRYYTLPVFLFPGRRTVMRVYIMHGQENLQARVLPTHPLKPVLLQTAYFHKGQPL